MGLRRKKTLATQVSRTAARCAKLPTPELAAWADNTVMLMGQATDNWRFHNHPIDDLMSLATAMKTIVEELQLRELTSHRQV